jgi:hypothetical protein
MATTREMPEKAVDVGVTSSPPVSPNYKGITDGRDLDEAFKYIQNSKQNFDEAAAENVDLKSLRRKIDWRILPIMFLCYTMQFLDKVNINVSTKITISSNVLKRPNKG